MARGRNTPYGAQLRRLLKEGDVTVFSAATLEPLFDHPQHGKLDTRLGGIHKALMKAFADGAIVAFVDDDGNPLRETDVKVARSKAIAQPRFFGRPGAEGPDPAFHPVSYEESLRRGITLDDDTGNTDGNAAAANGHVDRNVHVGSPDDDDADPAEETTGDGEQGSDEGERHDEAPAPTLTVEEAIARLAPFPCDDETAPAWVEERVLRAWTSLDCVVKHMVQGLNQTAGADKFELIRAGVTRKQRNWRPDSLVAGNLAKLCRTKPAIWRNVAHRAIKHYLGHDENNMLAEGLPRLIDDPLDFYEQSEHPPEAVLLCAIALDLDESTLELLAADCARELGELTTADKASAQEERIRALEMETGELRRTARDAEKELKDARKREQQLVQEIEALRAARAEAGDAADAARSQADATLRARAEGAEAALEKLESERIPELEAEIEGLEGAGQRLEEAEAQLREERRLRVQAEDDAKRHNARVRELTEDLSKVAGSRNLPVEDADALIDALSRPVGQAARHAAERLATGRARPHDDLLLELAASVAQMTRRLDVDDAAAVVAEEAAEVAEATATEAGVIEALAVDALLDADAQAAAAEQEAEATPSEPEAEGAEDTATEPAAGDEPAAEPEPATQIASPAAPARPLRRRSKLRVRPLGGAGEVGGSAILVTNNAGHTVLLDCGQRVRGEYGLDTEPQFHRRLGQEGRLHGILISHAHIDHVGSLPVLHREQSEAQHEPIPIYMTAPTRRLASLMLEDSAKIQQHREANPGDRGFLDYGAGTMEAAYRPADVRHVLDDDFVREVSPGLAVPIPDTSFVARFLPVAHVLGSCAIHLTDTDNDQTLLYSGDLGPIADPQATLPQYALGEMLAADLVIMESTYGAQQPEFTDGRSRRRSLSPREAAVKRLCQYAEHAHDNDGCVLLPAFSLGRTQELAMLIDQARREGEAPAGEIIVAGMGEKITHVYNEFSKGANPWARAQDMPRVDELGGRLRRNPDMGFEEVVDEALAGGFSYIIASPAMLASGWSRTFLENMIDNASHAVVMSGYVPRNSGGIPGLHRMHTGATMNISGRNVRVMAKFDQLKGLSAHAPAIDLHKFAEYMARQGNGTAFAMVHGEQAAQEALAADIDALPECASAESLHNGLVWQPNRS